MSKLTKFETFAMHAPPMPDWFPALHLGSNLMPQLGEERAELYYEWIEYHANKMCEMGEKK